MDEENLEDTLAFLAEHDLTYLGVDMPQGHPSSIPPVLAATSGLAVVRLHGHSDGWAGKSVDERFAYLYSEAELEHWAVRIRELAARAEVTHVLFNNCCRDNAQRNAARFRALVEEAGEPGGQDGQGEIWTAGRLRGTAT